LRTGVVNRDQDSEASRGEGYGEGCHPLQPTRESGESRKLHEFRCIHSLKEYIIMIATNLTFFAAHSHSQLLNIRLHVYICRCYTAKTVVNFVSLLQGLDPLGPPLATPTPGIFTETRLLLFHNFVS